MRVFYCDGYVMVLIPESVFGVEIRRYFDADIDEVSLGSECEKIPESKISPGAREYFAKQR